MKFLPQNPRHRRRLLAVSALMIAVGAATTLILISFEKNLMYFYTPSDIVNQRIQPYGVIELGGMVLPGSFQRTGDGLQVEFSVSDGASQLLVHYRGALPDLFREGQGVVVYGRLRDGEIHASRILARHDENYMPPHLERRLHQIESQHFPQRARTPQSAQ